MNSKLSLSVKNGGGKEFDSEQRLQSLILIFEVVPFNKIEIFLAKHTFLFLCYSTTYCLYLNPFCRPLSLSVMCVCVRLSHVCELIIISALLRQNFISNSISHYTCFTFSLCCAFIMYIIQYVSTHSV